MARQVKCFSCKEKENSNLMHCEETAGKSRITRRYFHHNCYRSYLEEKEFKRIEAEKWNELYQHVLKVHSLSVLDGRMIEKLQDLRNGSIKYGGKKIEKYKSGVEYDIILEAYKQQSANIEWNIKNRDFQGRKWNEFSYIFSIVANSVNDVKASLEAKKNQENHQKVMISNFIKNYEPERIIESQTKKKDELDISAFL